MVEKKFTTNVVFGGWYQRTTLHLSEIHRLLVNCETDLELSSEKLKSLRQNLNLSSVRRISGLLEHINFETKSGIKIRYFEDGLYTLSKRNNNVLETEKEIKKYFYENFQPLINYLFSLGAPTPKILSNMKESHVFILQRVVNSVKNSKVDKSFGKVYLETISRNMKVSKTKNNIIIDIQKSKIKELDNLTDMHVFFSDFKLQLHKYLNIHRKVWEEIEKIKEAKYIQGNKIAKSKSMLDSYQKTIQLIKNRINQMDNYAKTRQNISRKTKIDDELNELFQYRFEDLFNTLEYVKDIWAMTLEYVDSAIRILDGVQNKANSRGIKSIQFLVGVGVVSGIVKYFSPQSLPEFAWSGVPYVLSFGVLAIIIDKVIKWIGNKKKYSVSFVKTDKEI